MSVNPTPESPSIPLSEPFTEEWGNLTHTGRAPVPPTESAPLPAPEPEVLDAAEPDTPEETHDVTQSESLETGELDFTEKGFVEESGVLRSADRATGGFQRRPLPGRPRPGLTFPGVASDLHLRKFRDRLTQPPLIRAWRRPAGSVIRIAAEPATVRLHADLPPTTAWTYEGSIPGPTIEAMRDREVRIDWINNLTDRRGQAAALPYDVVRLPSLTDPDLGFNADVVSAMSPGGRSTSRGQGSDAYPPLAGTEEVRAATVVHLHGALTHGHDDGWAHNVKDPGGKACCTYPNQQQAATLWYHDHAMAVTRFNVHAGLAGFYLVRDRQEQGLRLPSGDQEKVLMIADRNLESLPQTPAGATHPLTGRVLYKQAGFTVGPDATPGELPQTGPYNLVNGTIWPRMDAQARWYRLRIVNGANARIYRLAVHDTTEESHTSGTQITAQEEAFTANRVTDALVVIGTDGGLLPAPVRPQDGTVEIGPGERLDVLLDLTRYRGRTLELRNEQGTALNAQPGTADASIMQIVVSSQQVRDRFRLPQTLNAGYRRTTPVNEETVRVGNEEVTDLQQVWVAVIPAGVRGGGHVEMWELAPLPADDPGPGQDVIRVSRAGRVLSFRPVAKLFDDTTSIIIPEGKWAVWNFLHLGGPDHPMHIHMAQFQMMTRRQWPLAAQGGRVEEFDLATGSTTSPLPEPGPGRPIDPITAGMKDTWVVRAGEWVQVLGHFAGATGSFMYHCHILDHEDVTMMRPFVVLPPSLHAVHTAHTHPSH